MRLILASGSKQRKVLLDMLDWDYEIIKSNAKEISNSKNPKNYVIDLSLEKAKAVADIVKENAIIVSADSIVYKKGKIYEKPKDKQEAFTNIVEMAGRNVYAFTGVTIIDLYKNKTLSFADKIRVKIKDVGEDVIKWYVDNDPELLNRSGFSIWGKGAIFVDGVKGDYNSLFGISPCKIFDSLTKLGYKISDFAKK